MTEWEVEAANKIGQRLRAAEAERDHLSALNVELLAACEAAQRFLDANQINTDSLSLRLRAVIAKAKGEQP